VAPAVTEAATAAPAVSLGATVEAAAAVLARAVRESGVGCGVRSVTMTILTPTFSRYETGNPILPKYQERVALRPGSVADDFSRRRAENINGST